VGCAASIHRLPPSACTPPQLAWLALSTGASVLRGLAPSPWILVAARAAQGARAAVLMALTLAFVGAPGAHGTGRLAAGGSTIAIARPLAIARGVQATCPVATVLDAGCAHARVRRQGSTSMPAAGAVMMTRARISR
jgi:hypothetical protein